MVRLRTLGTIDLHDARGAELRAILVQPRRLALLISLALTTPRGFQRRDRLVALFWPEENSERARASLNRAVYFLRRALGEGIVVSRGVEEIGLDHERFWCDADAFDTAVAAGDVRGALELYQGDLMPGFFVSRAPGFEEWLEGERTRLRALACKATWARVEVEAAAGNVPSAASWAYRAVELAPFDEPGIRRLLVLLDRCGDRAGVAAVYRRFSESLTAQLGLAPAPQTRALIETIRRQREPEATVAETPDVEPTDAADDTPVSEPASLSRPRFLTNRSFAAWSAALLVIGAGIAAAILNGPRPAVDPLRVDVEAFVNLTGNPALDRLSSAGATRVLEGLVQAGLVRTVPEAPAGVAWRTEVPRDSVLSLWQRVRGRAGTVVSGAYRREAGTVSLRVTIADYRYRNRVWSLAPVTASVTAVDKVLDQVRTRVAGGVAVLNSPYYASLLPIVSAPPTVEAYQEFQEGLKLQAARGSAEAVRHFRLAVAHDSGFTWPLVHAALSGIGLANPRAPQVDSILGELDAARERLSPLERHLVEYLRAVRVEDWEGCYSAIREAAAIAPDQFSYTEAVRAMQLQRPREALVALTRPRMDSIYRDDTRNYWYVLTLSYHQLGEHRRELAAARAARRHNPANARLLTHEIRALGALGRTAAVLVRLDTLLALPRDEWYTPAIALMLLGADLRTHGQDAAATEALARAIAWYKGRPPVEAEMEARRFFLAWSVYLADHLEDADSLFRDLHSEHPDNVDYIGHLGAIAARRGHHAAARDLADQLKGRAVEAPIPGEESIVWRARIAALLGERTDAMRLLIEAFGPQGTMELHNNSDFDGMRDYPPFREFIRPKG
jgi:DNA-binding SARP family transcriptional activator/tetratricopeptide (TPR) repeat protein